MGPEHGTSPDNNSVLYAEYGEDQPPPKLLPMAEPQGGCMSHLAVKTLS